MTKEEILSSVKQAVSDVTGAELTEVTNDSTITALGGDSLDVVEVCMKLEKLYDIKVSDHDFYEYFDEDKTVSDYADYIDGRVNG